MMRQARHNKHEWRARRNAYRIFERNPERKRPIESYRHIWEDYIKIDHRKNRMVWTGFVWLRIGANRGLL
jgi:hypothetical protein